MIDGLTVAGLSDTGAQLKRALSMEDSDLTKSFDELLKPTDPPKEAALENTTEVLDITSLESILPRCQHLPLLLQTNSSRTTAL